MKLFSFILIFSISNTIFGQDLTVPNSILNELSTSVFVVDGDSVCFKYTYPENYDSTKNYPVLLGLAGGNQSEFIVDYCYASWFRSHYFKDYFIILPVNVLGKNLRSYSNKDISRTLSIILKNFNVSNENWILSGTSNGGVAGYNFIACSPRLFHGIITVPGSLSDTLTIDENWSHLHALNAVGQNDSDGWKSAVKKTSDSLNEKVKINDLITLEGVGHILPLDFNINLVYDRYFSQTVGMDGRVELNTREIQFLNNEFGKDFSNSKVAFISGSGGSRVISKHEYFRGFQTGSTSSHLIELTTKEKKKSGGYDFLITKWVKVQPKKYRKRIIKSLGEND